MTRIDIYERVNPIGVKSIAFAHVDSKSGKIIIDRKSEELLNDSRK